MSIISLNEKRSSDNPTHTTGKEVSHLVSDQFPFPLADPKLTGYYHYRSQAGEGGAAFGAFWEDVDGNVSDLTFESTSSPTFSGNERTTSTHSQSSSAWSSFEIDLTGKPNGRPVFYVRRGSGNGAFKADISFDDIDFLTQNDTTISLSPSTSGVMSGGFWMKSTIQYVTSYSEAKSDYPPVTLSTIPNSTSSNHILQFNFGTGQTPSSNTGPDNAADNNDSTPYIYWEGSANGYNTACSYLTWKAYRNIVTGEEI